MIDDTKQEACHETDRTDLVESRIEWLGLWIVRIAALPFLVVGIVVWAVIMGGVALGVAVARTLGALSVHRAPEVSAAELYPRAQARAAGRQVQGPTSL